MGAAWRAQLGPGTFGGSAGRVPAEPDPPPPTGGIHRQFDGQVRTTVTVLPEAGTAAAELLMCSRISTTAALVGVTVTSHVLLHRSGKSNAAIMASAPIPPGAGAATGPRTRD
jgi:hypothetical protein